MVGGRLGDVPAHHLGSPPLRHRSPMTISATVPSSAGSWLRFHIDRIGWCVCTTAITALQIQVSLLLRGRGAITVGVWRSPTHFNKHIISARRKPLSATFCVANPCPGVIRAMPGPTRTRSAGFTSQPSCSSYCLTLSPGSERMQVIAGHVQVVRPEGSFRASATLSS
jgi:hypothetical protein